MEEFDEAKRLKDTIERLKMVSGHISQLEERKRIAIQNEDYEAAKVIKVEIEKLKSSVMYPGFQQPQIPPQYYGQGPVSVMGQGIGGMQMQGYGGQSEILQS